MTEPRPCQHLQPILDALVAAGVASTMSISDGFVGFNLDQPIELGRLGHLPPVIQVLKTALDNPQGLWCSVDRQTIHWPVIETAPQLCQHLAPVAATLVGQGAHLASVQKYPHFYEYYYDIRGVDLRKSINGDLDFFEVPSRGWEIQVLRCKDHAQAIACPINRQ